MPRSAATDLARRNKKSGISRVVFTIAILPYLWGSTKGRIAHLSAHPGKSDERYGESGQNGLSNDASSSGHWRCEISVALFRIRLPRDARFPTSPAGRAHRLGSP